MNKIPFVWFMLSGDGQEDKLGKPRTKYAKTIEGGASTIIFARDRLKVINH